MKRLDLCVHEAGHAIVALHFLGPCIKAITVAERKGSVQHVRAEDPRVDACIAVAGGIAERLLTPGATDPNPSAQDWSDVEGAYLAWCNGTTNTFERRAFIRSTVRYTKRILLARRAQLIALANTLATGGDVPDEYLSPEVREAKAHAVTLARVATAKHETKAYRRELEYRRLAQIEAGCLQATALSGRYLAREGWDAK